MSLSPLDSGGHERQKLSISNTMSSEIDDGEVETVFVRSYDEERLPLLHTITDPSTETLGIECRRTRLTSGEYWKNLIVLSLGFLFTFSAYGALSNLQSTLNYSSGLGVASLCATYIGIIVSSFLSPIVIWILGIKWTLVFCSVFYALYSTSNLYPAVFTLIPTAALLGLAASPFWTACSTYLTTAAIQLADVKNDNPETIINRFNGVFFCFFKSSQVWGNLMSSLVLRNSSSDTTFGNCGRSSCGTGVDFANLTHQDVGLVNRQELILISIYIVLGLLATLIFIFVGNLPSEKRRDDQWKSHFSEHLVATFQIMRSPYLLLLIPLMTYSGAEAAYFGADFTQSFVTCTQGADMVGYVMIGYGVANAIASAIFGQLEKYTGRIVIFMFGGIVHMALLVGFELWNPTSSAMWQLVMMAAGWGIGDAVWMTQISSILGVLFPESQEPAFANLRLWQSVGYSVSYVLTILPAICLYDKHYILMGILGFSLVCYIIEECLIASASSRNDQ